MVGDYQTSVYLRGALVLRSYSLPAFAGATTGNVRRRVDWDEKHKPRAHNSRLLLVRAASWKRGAVLYAGARTNRYGKPRIITAEVDFRAFRVPSCAKPISSNSEMKGYD